MAPWPRAPVIPQLVDRKIFRDNRWVKHLSLTSWTATAGSDVVQSVRPIFDEFSNICGRISAITRQILSSKWSSVYGLST
ncbi:hypothetical protein TNCV_401941 [Trichonephila clavipes]|nr:hypothetical protein TNCV_401941 [Trichonephila clavipes]